MNARQARQIRHAQQGSWKRLGYVAFVIKSAEGRRAPIGSGSDADLKLYGLQREQIVNALQGLANA